MSRDRKFLTPAHFSKSMQLKKFVFLFLFTLIIALSSIHSADGILWGEKDIRVIQTQWFDIIYPQSSKESAALLAENADRIYYEIAELYGRTPQARMPVVLSPKYEVSNAYFSVQFYNHIVLYDTAPVDELAIFTNDLLSTFRHELTHAFTYNIKNGFWAGFDSVFGDSLNPAGLFITLGWAEGATLTSESANGEGRLNDEYSKHVVKQAKIENKFPAYADVQGASDKYPMGAYYNFNGAFNEWLQKKYGMEKYAQFWYKCVNFQTLTTHGAFKKVYGIKIEQAWNQFKNDIDIPSAPPTPLEFSDLEIRDFFNNKKKYSAQNNGGALFTSLAASQNHIAWLEENSQAIFIISKAQAQEKNPKPKKLFCVNGAQSISLSADGKYLAVSYIDQGAAAPKCRIKIYDLQSKKWIAVKESGMSNGAIVQSDGAHYLVSFNFYSNKRKISIQKIGGKSAAKETPLLQNSCASDFTDIGNGKFAFLRRTGIQYTLCVADIQGNTVLEQKLPHERMAIKNLSFDSAENILYFSYAIPKSMPRLGAYDIEKKTFLLNKNDISGGIFYPIKLRQSEFLYVGKFFRQNRLFKLDAQNLFEQSAAPESTAQTKNEFPQEKTAMLTKPVDEILLDSKKYNPFKYFTKGLFLPIGIVPSYSLDVREGNFNTSQILFLGATYMTNNPWNSNTFAISAGYSPFTNSGGISFSTTGGTDTSLFKWSAYAQSEFDFEGWKQSFAQLDSSFAIPFGKCSNIVLANEAFVFAERDNAIYAKENASLYYTSIHYSGCGLYEKSGIAFGASFIYEAIFDLKTPKLYSESAANISPFVRIAIPKLIPIECRDFFVYNLPTTLRLSAFDKSDHFATASIDTVLFSMDIQKAIPALTAIFVNRFYFLAGYSISLLREWSSFGIEYTPELFKDAVNRRLLHTDYIHFDGQIEFTPNFGILANPIFRTGFGMEARYYFNRPQNYKTNWNILFNLSTNIYF